MTKEQGEKSPREGFANLVCDRELPAPSRAARTLETHAEDRMQTLVLGDRDPHVSFYLPLSLSTPLARNNARTNGTEKGAQETQGELSRCSRLLGPHLEEQRTSTTNLLEFGWKIQI